MPMKPLSNVSSPYGAPMGRRTSSGFYDRKGDWMECAVDGSRPFYLARVRLDSGGYDSGGAYWGIGAPLYRFEHSGLSDISGFVRAEWCPPENWDATRSTAWRNGAKQAVRRLHPQARFFR